MTQHFLRLSDFSPTELHTIIQRGIELKQQQQGNIAHETCKRKTLAMIFELSSTRTRVSFEAGMAQLGGHSLFLSPRDTQLGRGEPIGDTARVLAKMVDIVMIRAADQGTIDEYARYSSIPVINGMSNELHPCQLLADVMTIIEIHGKIEDLQVAFVGDGYNMCNSFIEASRVFNFDLRIATPKGYEPKPQFLQCATRTQLVASPNEAVAGADVVVTDVWSSMGHEDQTERKQAFETFQISTEVLDRAKPNVVLLHCLPAHRGEEVDEYVLDDPRSAVWEESGNRLHAQKALLEFLLN
ncbi:MAG: ornithine carbamoyltransferase [Gammaproteobacteria bacterium]|nr:ornithine carbamoyltransferase [Gammaproteobacteria bacterium]